MITSLQKILPQNFVSITVTPAVLRQRILQFFGMGVGLSLLSYLIYLSIFSEENPIAFIKAEHFSYYILLVHPLSFFLGFLLVLARRWSSEALQMIDLGISLFNLFGMTALLSAISPASFILFPYTIFLLLHAVMIPCRLWIQAFLAIAAVVIYSLGQIFTYLYLSEVQKLLLTDGGSKAFWGDLILRFLEINILAGVSVLITHNLYRSWKELSQAQRLGNYIIEKQLETGGMGKIYVASHQFMCRPAALKVMENNREDLQTCIARFEREVKLSATLTHPNTITIFDYGHSADHIFYYAMELLEGFDLNKIVERFGPMPYPRVVYILSQVCSALSEAHGVGIIHRDIKPSNIFLSCRGGIYDFVKVLDFGLAKEMGLESKEGDITKKTIILGTPRYLAPECVYDKDKIDARSDIYMLGCVAYWLLTGHPPFDAPTDAEIIRAHLNETPRRFSEITSLAIPQDLEKMVMKCLEKKQEDRYQSACEFAESLNRIRLDETWSQNKAREWWNLHYYHQNSPPSVPFEVVFSERGKMTEMGSENEKEKQRALH